MLHTGQSSEHSGNQGKYWGFYFHTMIVYMWQNGGEHSGNQSMYWEL